MNLKPDTFFTLNSFELLLEFSAMKYENSQF